MGPEEVARRELLEEVGGRAADLRSVGQFYTSNGICNEVAYVYFAAGVELGETHHGPTELMELRLVPVEEALRMTREGEVTDGPSALALLWCERLWRIQRHSTEPAGTAGQQEIRSSTDQSPASSVPTPG